jgi:hypothetical protein
MTRKTLVTILALALLVVFLALNVRVGYAAPRNGYEISWYTIDGGGTQDLSGGTYTLSGTAGQFDAGLQSSGSYTLNGGFWVELFGARLYLPLILR